MLQAQGDIECPAESNLSQALAAIQFTYSVACGRPDQPEMWQLLADNECRRLADRALGARARLEHRKRWCDKSLSNIEYTSLLCRLFPDAQFLSIYRQCRDVIASALEASPWGLMGYGFEPYARETPANQVLALARYWADRTELGLAFERQHPNNCLGVKYEALVTYTDPTLSKLFGFLQLPYSEDAFTDEHLFHIEPTLGPEDYKIGLATSVYSSSVGRGEAIPLEDLIPDQLLERITYLEQQLGYLEPALGMAKVGDLAPPQTASSEPLPWLVEFRCELDRRLRSARYRPPPDWAAMTISIEICGLGEIARLDLEARTLVDPSGTPPAVRLVTTYGTLQDLATGVLDAAVAWHSALIRLASNGSAPPNPAHALSARAVLPLLNGISNDSTRP
jgi:hypothetical protein